jgi:hypothetical protein
MGQPMYGREERKLVTFAEVSAKIGGDPALGEVLRAFGSFLASQENVRLSRYVQYGWLQYCISKRLSGHGLARNQLKVLKSQSVLVLEESARCNQAGRDLSEILPAIAR